MAVLKILKGTNPGQVLELHGERMTIGRHPNCRVVLDNSAVSRHHAQILESHGSYFLEDLRSRNGTLLNGQRIEGRTLLQDRDQITVCDYVFRFYAGVSNVSDMERDIQDFSDEPGDGHEALRMRSTAIAADRRSRLLRSADDEDELSESSSIVSTLNVSSLRHLRLQVRPEAKLRAVMEISNSLGNTLRLEDLLPKILEGLFRIFSQADRGVILLRDAESGELAVKAVHLRHEERARSAPISTTIINQALQSAQAILSEDALIDDRFQQSESVANLQIHSIMCVPLIGQAGTVLGIIQIDTQDARYRFSQDDLDLLASVACQAALAVENAALHEEVLKRRDLERELEFATQVQLGFLPTEQPRLAEYEFYDFYEAAFRVGGDFFDYITLPDGRVAVAVGDVAGKGIPAALLMARLYSMARYHLLAEPSVAKAVTSLNAGIASSGLGHRFITFVIVVIDPKRHELTIVNAGHLPPLLRYFDGSVVPLTPDVSGLPLGVRLDHEYAQETVPIRPGDTVLLFTDGVNEAMNPRNEIYGIPRLMEFLSRAEGTVEQVGEALVEDVDAFCEERPQRDDICLVCFRRSPSLLDAEPPHLKERQASA